MFYNYVKVVYGKALCMQYLSLDVSILLYWHVMIEYNYSSLNDVLFSCIIIVLCYDIGANSFSRTGFSITILEKRRWSLLTIS